jgi:hypothetical protein
METQDTSQVHPRCTRRGNPAAKEKALTRLNPLTDPRFTPLLSTPSDELRALLDRRNTCAESEIERVDEQIIALLYRRVRPPIEYALLGAIDVGFDLRRHDMEANLAGAEIVVYDDRAGLPRLAAGDPEWLARKLRAAGYRVCSRADLITR